MTQWQDGAKRARMALIALGMAGLTGCGGGGGGGSANPPTPAPAPVQGMTLAQAALNWDLEEADPAGAQFVTGSIEGVTEPVFLFVEYTNTAISSAQFELTGTTTGRLTVNPRPWSALQPGTYQDRITVRACFDTACTRQVAGSPKSVDVTYRLRAATSSPALTLSQYGVAFAAAPHGRRLTQAVTVRDTGNDSSGWTASSDASWLRVTGAGVSGGSMTLSADDTGLAEGQYLATVTLRSDNPRITAPQTMRVGLYVTRQARAASTPGRPVEMPYAIPLVAVDPVRPVFYTAVDERVTARHFYTGAVLATWPLVPVTSPGIIPGKVLSMAVSDDGSELYALELTSQRVHVIDLNRLAVDRSFSVAALDRLASNGQLSFVRLNGRGLLFGNNSSAAIADIGASVFLNPQTGVTEGRLPLSGAGLNLANVVTSVDGRYLYTTRTFADTELLQVRPAINSKGVLFGRETVRPVLSGMLQAMPGGGVLAGLRPLQSVGDTLVDAPAPIRDALMAQNPNSIVTYALGRDGRMLIATNVGVQQLGSTWWLFAPDGQVQARWQDGTYDFNAFWPSYSAMPLCLSSDGLRAQSDYKLIDLPR